MFASQLDSTYLHKIEFSFTLCGGFFFKKLFVFFLFCFFLKNFYVLISFFFFLRKTEKKNIFLNKKSEKMSCALAPTTRRAVTLKGTYVQHLRSLNDDGYYLTLLKSEKKAAIKSFVKNNSIAPDPPDGLTPLGDLYGHAPHAPRWSDAEIKKIDGYIRRKTKAMQKISYAGKPRTVKKETIKIFLEFDF